MEQWAESLTDSAEAIRINPNFAEAYNARGQTLQMHGDLVEAEADFTKAVELFPTFASAVANRAYNRVLQENYAGAIEDYYRAIRLVPDDAVLLNDAAWLLATCPEIEYCNGDHAVQLARARLRVDRSQGIRLPRHAGDGVCPTGELAGSRALGAAGTLHGTCRGRAPICRDDCNSFSNCDRSPMRRNQSR